MDVLWLVLQTFKLKLNINNILLQNQEQILNLTLICIQEKVEEKITLLEVTFWKELWQRLSETFRFKGFVFFDKSKIVFNN